MKKKNHLYENIIYISLGVVIFFYPTLISHDIGFIGAGIITIPLEIGVILMSFAGMNLNDDTLVKWMLGVLILGLIGWSVFIFSERIGGTYKGYSIISQIEKNMKGNQSSLIRDAAR